MGEQTRVIEEILDGNVKLIEIQSGEDEKRYVISIGTWRSNVSNLNEGNSLLYCIKTLFSR